jgi:hypothetical protein
LFILVILLVFSGGTGVFSQAAQDSAEGTIPLRRIALFSSGVAFFEHEGRISGPAEFDLPFHREAVNDALKSLIVRDSNSVPQISYPSEETLYRTLRSLSIDLSAHPGTAGILESLRGAEIEALTGAAGGAAIKGRILGIEYRSSGPAVYTEGRFPVSREDAFLSVSTAAGIRVIPLADIASFAFTDPQIRADLERALDLILASRGEETRNLRLSLPGSGSRQVWLSYVIPSPVWKVSYRLDLNQKGLEPLFQGWAIIDNDGDTDWTGVELTLVSGRPVSFIQNLYPPFRLFRPTLPLSIAGTAQARTYDSGFGRNSAMAQADSVVAAEMEPEYKEMSRSAPTVTYAPAPSPLARAGGGAVAGAAGGANQDQFQFKLEKPVTLERQRSAMLPLIEGTIQAEKILVFSGNLAAGGATVHPAISVELTNTTGMKLPAGPVTVFDGGTYGGDALLEFLTEGEKRIISYADDLAVTGTMTADNTQGISAVSISGGVMTVVRKTVYRKTYTIKNASAENKKLILEHTFITGTELSEPASFDERTGTLYRFKRDLPGNGEITVRVSEESPRSERVVLSQTRDDVILGYVSNQELSREARDKLRGAVELKQGYATAETAMEEIQRERSRQESEQDRVRKNLEAAGSESVLGQEYLKRLSGLDDAIDALNLRADEARNATREARLAYEKYLAELSL